MPDETQPHDHEPDENDDSDIPDTVEELLKSSGGTLGSENQFQYISSYINKNIELDIYNFDDEQVSRKISETALALFDMAFGNSSNADYSRYVAAQSKLPLFTPSDKAPERVVSYNTLMERHIQIDLVKKINNTFSVTFTEYVGNPTITEISQNNILSDIAIGLEPNGSLSYFNFVEYDSNNFAVGRVEYDFLHNKGRIESESSPQEIIERAVNTCLINYRPETGFDHPNMPRG